MTTLHSSLKDFGTGVQLYEVLLNRYRRSLLNTRSQCPSLGKDLGRRLPSGHPPRGLPTLFILRDCRCISETVGLRPDSRLHLYPTRVLLSISSLRKVHDAVVKTRDGTRLNNCVRFLFTYISKRVTL